MYYKGRGGEKNLTWPYGDVRGENYILIYDTERFFEAVALVAENPDIEPVDVNELLPPKPTLNAR